MHILPLIIAVCMKFITYIYIFHIYVIFLIKDLTANLLYPERCRLKKFYDAASLREKKLI